MASLHLFCQYDQNEVQYAFGHLTLLASESHDAIAKSVVNDNIILVTSQS